MNVPPRAKHPPHEPTTHSLWDPAEFSWPLESYVGLQWKSFRRTFEGGADLASKDLEELATRALAGLRETSESDIEQRVLSALSMRQASPSGVQEALSRIESALSEVTTRLKALELAVVQRQAAIQTLAPGPYDLNRPISVALRPTDAGFEATFFDANLHGGGDTEEEAIDDLKATIVEIFEVLTSLPDEELGPIPRTQKAVLRDFVRIAK
ncbi:MAG: hypothetical protein KGL59_09335 [Acidobacteriota bacterium]|nr:hypothetical protein [Acidobacteriota bacterium]